MVKDRVMCTGIKPEEWKDEHDEAVNVFVVNHDLRLLIGYVNVHYGFCLDFQPPAFAVDQLCYFIKKPGDTPLTKYNFLKNVQYGTVRGKYIESLMRNMLGIYAPIFFESTTWPDSIHLASLLFS